MSSDRPIEEFLNDSMKFFKIGVVAVLLLFVWGGISSTYYTVDVSEEGVVVRFGQYLKTTPPGLHFKLPFGIDTVYKVA